MLTQNSITDGSSIKPGGRTAGAATATDFRGHTAIR
jgi:hypothetical protein